MASVLSPRIDWKNAAFAPAGVPGSPGAFLAPAKRRLSQTPRPWTAAARSGRLAALSAISALGCATIENKYVATPVDATSSAATARSGLRLSAEELPEFGHAHQQLGIAAIGASASLGGLTALHVSELDSRR